MPSIKKRVTGFIRQLSTTGGAGGGSGGVGPPSGGTDHGKRTKADGSKSPRLEASIRQDNFIQKYLNG